jgi:hypothetical protein
MMMWIVGYPLSVFKHDGAILGRDIGVAVDL